MHVLARPRAVVTRALGLVAVAVALVALSGCTTMRYLTQAGFGQLDIRLRARDIDAVMKDPSTPPRLRELLGEVAPIKRFGERHGLKPTKNYTEYVALNRSAAVWVVSACEPLRFESKTWSFPIVGTVPYLGWFDKGDARDFADDLKDDGWDVDLRGADAYSTLGWFTDPILSTMISAGSESVGDLANVVLHESLHATFYIKDQTLLDESVASFTGDTLAEAYLDERYGAASTEKAAYVRLRHDGDRRALALHDGYRRLEALYASPKPREAKLAEKQKLLAVLTAELGPTRPLNNATLAQFKVYNEGRAELEALLAACGGSYPRWLAALRRLDATSFEEPNQEDVSKVLSSLVRGGCSPAAPREAAR